MARGVAYGTTSDMHVLNVPAGRMSAFDDDPDSFVRFVRARGVTEHVDGGTFVGRHLYGAYLESLLAEACEQAPEGRVERLNTEVVAIEPEHDGSRRLGLGLAARRQTHPRGARRARGGKLSARRSARGLRRLLRDRAAATCAIRGRTAPSTTSISTRPFS